MKCRRYRNMQGQASDLINKIISGDALATVNFGFDPQSMVYIGGLVVGAIVLNRVLAKKFGR